MKKFLVVGNPINHSLSPQLHNYWFKENNIKATYEKILLKQEDIKKIIKSIETGEVQGVNVTLPHKKAVIPFLDELTLIAKQTQSVNTIFTKNGKIVGDNTDSEGFKKALEHTKFEIKNKSALILGAGGVVPSIIYALKKLDISRINVSNRTKGYAEEIKKIYPFINVIDWGTIQNSDIIINATSLGLNKEDKIDLDFKNIGKNKLFYDLIYNPSKTNFLLKGEETGNKIENGKLMFAFQAQLSFSIWTGVEPKVDNKVLEILNND